MSGQKGFRFASSRLHFQAALASLYDGSRLRLILEHHRGPWSNQVMLQAIDKKNDVEAVRNELRTPGYALVNLGTSYRWRIVEGADLRFDAGIDNLANRTYASPLGGRYWVDNTGSTPVPGYGRSFFGGFTFLF